MTSVNLLPTDCLAGVERGRKLRLWTGTFAIAVIATGVVGQHAWSLARQRDRLAERVKQLQAAEAPRALEHTRLLAERAASAARAEALLGMESDTEALAGLRGIAANTPDGVLFTRLRMRVEERAAPPRPVPTGATRSGSGGPPTPATPETVSTTRVEIAGLALGHGDVEALITSITRHSEWKAVTLVRSAREPGSHDLLSFELDCRRDAEIP